MEYYLIHHGIKGQKWGVRRYRNEDGSRTSKGKERINNVKIKIQNTSSKVKDKYNHLSADKKKKLNKKEDSFLGLNIDDETLDD